VHFYFSAASTQTGGRGLMETVMPTRAGMSPATKRNAAAAKKAFEEAGVRGKVRKRRFWKKAKKRAIVFRYLHFASRANTSAGRKTPDAKLDGIGLLKRALYW
jgi:hypothetical protein